MDSGFSSHVHQHHILWCGLLQLVIMNYKQRKQQLERQLKDPRLLPYERERIQQELHYIHAEGLANSTKARSVRGKQK
jgi:hypothetical protein